VTAAKQLESSREQTGDAAGAGHQIRQAGLYNGMIAPLSDTIRGAIWYQGNRTRPIRPMRNFTAAVPANDRELARAWGQGASRSTMCSWPLSNPWELAGSYAISRRRLECQYRAGAWRSTWGSDRYTPTNNRQWATGCTCGSRTTYGERINFGGTDLSQVTFSRFDGTDLV